MIGGTCDAGCAINMIGGAPKKVRATKKSKRSVKSAKRSVKSAKRSVKSAKRSVKKGGNCSSSRSTSSCSGGARGKKLESEKKTSLYAKAQRYNIKGRSTMKKGQLAAAIRAHQKKIGEAIAKRGKK